MTDKGEADPVASRGWPERLTARVVDPGRQCRIHGYDLESDLARHYGFAEIILLTLTGEPPAEPTGRAFDLVLRFLCPSSVAEAPSHAAGLARLCGASAAGVLGAGSVVLGEQAAHQMAEQEDLLAWLEGVRAGFPPAATATEAAERESVTRLRDLLAHTGFPLPAAFEHDPTPFAAALSVLHACGLRTNFVLQTALMIARFPAVAAEASRVEPLDFGTYPLNLPRYRYEAGDRGDGGGDG